MKNYPFYLIFFAFDYSLMKFIPFKSLFLLLIMFIVLEGILFAVFYYLNRDVLRAGFLTLLSLSWVLYFGTAASIVQSLLGLSNNLEYLVIFLLPWTLAFSLLGSTWLWHKIPFTQAITAYLNVFTLVVILLFGYRLLFSLNYEFFEPITMTVSEPVQEFEASTRPDIYYIILDGYGRQDTLQKYLQYDNSQFIEFLESRGFDVADLSQANYNHTLYSISSSLNMNYINPTSQPVNLMAYSQTTISENWARSYLAGYGYQFITFYNPYMLTDITDADIYFPLAGQSRLGATRLEELLFPGSLAAILLEANLTTPSGVYRDYQEHLLSSLNRLAEIPSLPGAKFVFFHILIPHPPFIFNQNGPITPDQPYLLVRDFRGTSEERISGYLGQVGYLNQQMEKAIDAILENSSVPPIIIIQGDHGPGVYSNENFEGPCLMVKYSILNAYYLPGLSNSPVYETITPVNSFRIVFNQYFGANLELLDDKAYYDSSGESFRFIDVTQESQEACIVP
jgi:hypothetical protein